MVNLIETILELKHKWELRGGFGKPSIHVHPDDFASIANSARDVCIYKDDREVPRDADLFIHDIPIKMSVLCPPGKIFLLGEREVGVIDVHHGSEE